MSKKENDSVRGFYQILKDTKEYAIEYGYQILWK